LAASGAACATQYIFVTSSTSSGNLGGLEGADDRCNMHAASGSLSAPLNLTWRALLSVNGVVDAKDRFIWSGPLYDVSGSLVTNDPGTWPWVSAGSSTLHRDENGAVSAASYAWTGTTAAGVAKGAGFDCNGWTPDSVNAQGWSGETGFFPISNWIDSFADNCDSTYQGLYCVSIDDHIFVDGFEST
jgi:hypothetical protein